MLPVQASTILGLPTGAAAALKAPGNAATAQAGDRLNGPIDPDAVARPGPPSARLDLRTQTQAQSSTEAPAASSESVENKNADGETVDENGLTEAERKEVESLKERDREVREHERAHSSTGGSVTGTASFKFTQGPDGKSYAVSGEVSVDASPVPGNPQATLRKMELVARAALAPSEPSGQDRRVAAQARAAIIQARQEITEEKSEAKADKTQDPGSGQENEIGQDPLSNSDPQQPSGSRDGGGSLAPGQLLNLVA